jgi:GTPase
VTITRSVALVGRPNVGKSRLFNRLAGKRISIVHDQPGVTRDLVTYQLPVGQGGYLLMDTGGIGLAEGLSPAVIIAATEEQVDFALAAAGLVLFVTDIKSGLTHADERIAERLRQFRKPAILVVNKADDSQRALDAQGEFAQLGFKEMVAVSAEHGLGIEELEQKIFKVIGRAPEVEAPVEAPAQRIKFSLIGRPNVGKSSLGNALLKDKRLVVSEVPGTTRDAISIDFDFAGPDGKMWPFTLHDTAGLRPRPSVKTPVEFFSQNRSREAIADSDVVFLVLDAQEGVTKQDKVLAGDVIKLGRGLVIVVNKWDIARAKFEKKQIEGYANEREFREHFVRAIHGHMFFLPKSPVLFTSATEGLNVPDILKVARSVVTTMNKPLPTGPLNRVLKDYLEVQPPKRVGGRRFKCYYAVQVARQPFTIRMYCNSAEKLDDSYSRHLAAGVQEAFKLFGCPMRFDLVGKPPRKEGTKFTSAKPGEGGKFVRGQRQKRHTPHAPYVKHGQRIRGD